jgi:hypothetical protein
LFVNLVPPQNIPEILVPCRDKHLKPPNVSLGKREESVAHSARLPARSLQLPDSAMVILWEKLPADTGERVTM